MVHSGTFSLAPVGSSSFCLRGGPCITDFNNQVRSLLKKKQNSFVLTSLLIFLAPARTRSLRGPFLCQVLFWVCSRVLCRQLSDSLLLPPNANFHFLLSWFCYSDPPPAPVLLSRYLTKVRQSQIWTFPTICCVFRDLRTKRAAAASKQGSNTCRELTVLFLGLSTKVI